MGKKTNVAVSRQKIYDSLIKIREIYGSFDNLCVYVGFLPVKGLTLNVNLSYKVDRRWLIKESIDISEYLKDKDLFEMTEDIAEVLECWIKENNYSLDN